MGGVCKSLPRSLLGDGLVLIGAAVYAMLNIAEERLLGNWLCLQHDADQGNYIFVVVSGAQTLLLARGWAGAERGSDLRHAQHRRRAAAGYVSLKGASRRSEQPRRLDPATNKKRKPRAVRYIPAGDELALTGAANHALLSTAGARRSVHEGSAKLCRVLMADAAATMLEAWGLWDTNLAPCSGENRCCNSCHAQNCREAATG